MKYLISAGLSAAASVLCLFALYNTGNLLFVVSSILFCFGVWLVLSAIGE